MATTSTSGAANPVAAPLPEPAAKYLTNELTKYRALGYIGNLATALFGVGAGGRLALEATRALMPAKKLPSMVPDRVYLVPKKKQEEDMDAEKFASELVYAYTNSKVAGDPPAVPEDTSAAMLKLPMINEARKQLGLIGGWLADKSYPMLHDSFNHQADGMGGVMKGNDANGNIWGVPATAAVGLPLAAITGYGGWTLADKAIGSYRDSQKKKELEEARQKYDELARSLMSGRTKFASDNCVASDFDDMANAVASGLEKSAEGDWMDKLKESGGMAAGAYMSYAALMALLSGKLSHDFFAGRGEDKLTEEAMKRRMEARMMQKQPLMAVSPADEDEPPVSADTVPPAGVSPSTFGYRRKKQVFAV